MVNSRYFSSIAVRQYLANAEMHLLVRVFGYTYNRNKSITLPFLSAVSNAVVCHNIQYYFIVYIFIYIIWRGEKYKLARSQALQCSIAVVPWLQFFFVEVLSLAISWNLTSVVLLDGPSHSVTLQSYAIMSFQQFTPRDSSEVTRAR